MLYREICMRFWRSLKKTKVCIGNDASGYEASFVRTWRAEEEFNTYARKSILCRTGKRRPGRMVESSYVDYIYVTKEQEDKSIW